MHFRNKCDYVVQLGDVSISDTCILFVMLQIKHNTDCVTASSVNMFKNKVDTYLRRAGYK